MRSALGVAVTTVLVAVVAAGCGGAPQAAHPSTSTTHPPATTTTIPAATTTPAPPTTIATAPPTTAAPAGPLPDLTIAGWTGRDPVVIYFSGDAGNIATGLTWSVWNQTEAVGQGTRNELGCVPNCAQGTSTPYPVTLTLTDPVNGSFTSILEQTADGKGTTETFTTPYLAEGVCPTGAPSSCVFVTS
jgi:hypothetical protein